RTAPAAAAPPAASRSRWTPRAATTTSASCWCARSKPGASRRQPLQSPDARVPRPEPTPAAPVPHRPAHPAAAVADLGGGQVPVRAAGRPEQAAGRTRPAQHRRRQPAHLRLAGGTVGAERHRAGRHAARDPAGRLAGAAGDRPAPAALVRGAGGADPAGQHGLRQRPQVAGHPADQARRHPAGGADRLPAQRDEDAGLRHPRHARDRDWPRTGGGVRADHAQPDLRLPGDRADGEDHAHRLDGGPGDELHHQRRRGRAGQHPVRAAAHPFVLSAGAKRRSRRIVAAGFDFATLRSARTGIRMKTNLLDDRAVRLFVALAAFFCANAVLAEFIGVKIFALEGTLGIAPLHWNLLGQSGTLDFTAGTVIWPIVFIMTDTVNEYFGKRGVRLISWLAAGLVAYGFLFAYLAIHLAPASWWVGTAQDQGVPDYQAAFAAIFGQGMWITVGSLVAFLVGQLVDIQ